MPDGLPPGPYRTLRLDDRTEVPYYIIPFDKEGRCEGPETRAHLVTAVASGRFTDLFVFSHGWNNDWTAATERYEGFITGYMQMRRQHQLPVPSGYRPLLVGIFWPSTALTFGTAEEGPAIAAGDPGAIDRAVGAERAAIRELAEALPRDRVERFYALTQKESLSRDEARELATIVAPLYEARSDELQESGAADADAIVRTWQAAAAPPDDLDEVGTVAAPSAAGPQTAGLGDVFRALDPRQIVRVLTVRQMKDRAGTVGTNGVGPLLRDLLAATATQTPPMRLHAIGHSYGGKVMLSAIAAGPLPRKVHSLLLLQPAVSHLCFASQVPGTTRAGGYRNVLDRVVPPVVSTFSANDFPLTRVFHWALTRDADLGEARIAGDEPPSVYAALGGFGPRLAGETLLDIRDVNDRYSFGAAPIVGLRGTRTIGGHGDISNESTWWALYTLASR